MIPILRDAKIYKPVYYSVFCNSWEVTDDAASSMIHSDMTAGADLDSSAKPKDKFLF